jgi:hypothetical protein
MEAFYEAIRQIDVPKGQILFAEHFFASGWDAAIDALSLAYQRQFEEDGVDNQLIRREPQEPPPDDDQE